MTTSASFEPVGRHLRLEYGKALPEEYRTEVGGYPAYGANGSKIRSKKYLRADQSIIVGRKGSAGEITLSEPNFWPLDVTYFVEFDRSRHDIKYLFYLLRWLDIPRLAKGVKPGINRDDVYRLIAPFPPLAEQQRIVAILDDAFVKIVAVEDSAERNLRSAAEVFEASLASAFSSLADRSRPLGEMLRTSSGGTPLKSRVEFYAGGDIPWILSGEVAQGEVRTASNFITAAGLAGSSAKLFPPGTVLVAMYGATAGQTGILRFEAATNQAVCGIFPSAKALPEFLYLLFRAEKRRLVATAVGNAQPNISQAKIRSVRFPDIPLNEQQLVVERLLAIQSETNALAAIYAKKLALLAELKESLFARAFSGELTREPLAA